MTTTTTTLLIDADIVVMSVASACQQDIMWDDDIITRHTDLSDAQRTLDGVIEGYREALDDANVEIELAFSCPTRRYFRHELDATYKGNRKNTKPPLGLRELRAYAEGKYSSRTKPNLEADDVLGILATTDKIIPGTKIVVSTDKDLMQVPGLHLNPNDLLAGVVEVSPDMGQRFFWMQTLTGDATDGYPGCPGVGPVRAAAILDKVPPGDPVWPHIVATYQKAGLSEDYAVTQARLAKILTAADYDFKKQRPILWSPSASFDSKEQRNS